MKILKIIAIICLALCFFISLKIAKTPETNLISAFVLKNSKWGYEIKQLANVSGNTLNIIVEANDIETAQDIKAQIEGQLKKEDFSSKIIDVYKNYPGNFLTQSTIKLLENKNFTQIENNSLKMLYNPLGIYISPIEADPFLFATDWTLNLQKAQGKDIAVKNGKSYALIRYELSSPQDVKQVKDIINNLKDECSVYLSGTPVHTYETSKRSNIEINIICLLSTIMAVLLCLKCFKSAKILIPVAISIIFGFLSGFIFSTLIFKKLHILTFVFSASFIGISLDYSLHYFLSNKNPKFKKSLLTSLLSTVLTFGALFFSNIEILKQISVFVSFGLLGVYLFVIIFLPVFKISYSIKDFSPPDVGKFKSIILTVIIIIFALGAVRLKFDDSIKNLYKPNQKTARAEALYKDVFGQTVPNFIIVKGKNVDDIIEQEENITADLNQNGDRYLALCNFISSTKKQNKNLALVLGLYKERLDNYADFLDKKSKNKLLNKKEIYDPNNFPLNYKFMLNNNSSFIMVYSNAPNPNMLNIAEEMTKILKNFRHKCLTLIPLIFVMLLAVLKIFYSFKQSIKIILPPFLGGLFALFGTAIFIPVNVFHILAFILALGFSMDYSIFRLQGERKSNLAIFISCISTVFSFLLLSATSFKLISSMGLILSISIFTSYILSLVLISSPETQNI